MQLTQADRAAAQEAAQRIQTKLEGEVQRLQDQLKELERSSRLIHALGCRNKPKKTLILNVILELKQGKDQTFRLVLQFLDDCACTHALFVEECKLLLRGCQFVMQWA